MGTPLRSVLFVPAIVPRFIEKAPEAGADVLCLDLEDSVPPKEKAAAREAATRAVAALDGPYAVWVRINSWASGLLEDDLRAVVRQGLDAVMVPKTESAAAVEHAATTLTALEEAADLPRGGIGIVPLIETAKGVLASAGIAGASRVVACAFGSEDFCADLGVQRTREGEELRFPRAHIAIACAAAGVPAIDTVDTEFRDAAYLEREMASVRGLGFAGKLCIHPAQVDVANRVFSPDDEEIAQARAIVAAFEGEGLAKGRGAITLDGRMVDTPHYEAAKRLLARARVEGASGN